jgi:hypothetical protein
VIYLFYTSRLVLIERLKIYYLKLYSALEFKNYKLRIFNKCFMNIEKINLLSLKS